MYLEYFSDEFDVRSDWPTFEVIGVYDIVRNGL